MGMRRFLLLSGAVCAVAFAQCVIPPEVAGLNREQVQARIDAGQDRFILYLRLLDLTSGQPKPGPLAPMFAQLLARHAADPRFIYLHGRSLIGRNTPEAIAELRRAVSADPKLPWTYLALADIYDSPNFRDDQAGEAAVAQFRKLCPDAVEGFRRLDRIKDPQELAARAAELRALLESRPGAGGGKYWSPLWAAEFRAAPDSAYPKLRQRVAADLRRLEALPDHESRTMRSALLDGYKLANETEASARLAAGFDAPDSPVMLAYRELETRYQARTRNITRQEHEQMMREMAVASAEWVRKWPASYFAWSLRLGALPFAPTWSEADLIQAGEKVLELGQKRELEWHYPPDQLHVAEIWVRFGVRPEAALKLAEQALEEISRGPEQPSDLTANANTVRAMEYSRFGFDLSLWDAMGAVVDASLLLKRSATVRSTMDRMQRWLDDNAARGNDPTSGYSQFQGRWNLYTGKIAESDGRKLDALAYYAKAVASGGYRDYEADHARALWLEQGGSKDAWEVVSARPPRPAPPAKSNTTHDLPPFAAFAEFGKPMPELHLRDTHGAAWTLDRFKGKRTFVNVWATWCAPCREEFPSLVKLQELAKGRDDVQVVTLNVDDNPGLVAPFLAEYHATTPTLLGGRDYVSGFIGMLGVPQNWLVDRDGVVRKKTHGYYGPADWPRRMLDELLRLP